jgi:hypothetical protein
MLASARQIHHRIEFRFGKRFVLLDVVEGAIRHLGDVEAVERVLAVRAATASQARLSVSGAGASSCAAATFASTAQAVVYVGLLGHG